jgi:epoxide hydrolase 4
MAVDKSNFTAEVLDRYALDAQRPGAMTGMVNWYRASMRLQGKLAGPWPVIETPSLIVWGEEDAALGIELLGGTDAYVRDLTIERLPKVSHWVQQEAPEKVNAILKGWLAAPR